VKPRPIRFRFQEGPDSSTILHVMYSNRSTESFRFPAPRPLTNLPSTLIYQAAEASLRAAKARARLLGYQGLDCDSVWRDCMGRRAA